MKNTCLILLALFSFPAFADSGNPHVLSFAISSPWAPTDHDQQICDDYAAAKEQAFLTGNPSIARDSVFPYRLKFEGHLEHTGPAAPVPYCRVTVYKGCDFIFTGYYPTERFFYNNCSATHAELMQTIRATYPDALDIDYSVNSYGNQCFVSPLRLVTE